MVIDTIGTIGLISLCTLFTVPLIDYGNTWKKPKIIKLAFYLSIIFIVIGIISIIWILSANIKDNVAPVIPTGFMLSGVAPQILYHAMKRRGDFKKESQ